MENDLEEIKVTCPACGNVRTEFSFRKNGFDLYRCQICRHLFVYPIAYDALALYDADYFGGAKKGSGYVDYDADKEPMRSTFLGYLREIEKFLPQKGELLDVGAATGFFMRIAEKSGWKAKGVEISEYAAEEARNRGLDVRCGTLNADGFAEGSFDVVTMWDVLEHVTDPEADIRTVVRLLRPGGIVAINIPDSGSLYARIMGKEWHLLIPPEHLHLFSKRSVTALLKRSGFSVEKISKIGKSFTLEYIVQTAAAWRKSGLLRRLAAFLKRHPMIGRLSIPINLRDNMFIIARKNDATA